MDEHFEITTYIDKERGEYRVEIVEKERDGAYVITSVGKAKFCTSLYNFYIEL